MKSMELFIINTFNLLWCTQNDDRDPNLVVGYDDNPLNDTFPPFNRYIQTMIVFMGIIIKWKGSSWGGKYAVCSMVIIITE